jgi:hypothetical protein
MQPIAQPIEHNRSSTITSRRSGARYFALWLPFDITPV